MGKEEEKIDDKPCLAEQGFDAWLKAFLNEEIDADQFVYWIIFKHICNADIFSLNINSLTFAMDAMVSKKPFTHGDRKNIKEKLKKLMETINNPDKTEGEKNKEIEDTIFDVLEICGGSRTDMGHARVPVTTFP